MPTTKSISAAQKKKRKKNTPNSQRKYIPNIRKCIGVGGLNEPQAKNIIFFVETMFYAFKFKHNFKPIFNTLLMRQNYYLCAVKFKNMMHLFVETQSAHSVSKLSLEMSRLY